MPIPWIPRDGAAEGTDLPGFSSTWARAILCSRTRRVWTATAASVPQPSPGSEPRTALHEHTTASSGSSPSPHLRASASALFSKRYRHARGGTSKRGNSSICSGIWGSPTPGVWPLVVPFSPLRIAGFPASSENGALLRQWRCQVRSVVRMRRAMAAAPWLCQGRSQSSPRVPRPCHRATGRGPWPPPLPGGLSWSSRAGCRRRGAEPDTKHGAFPPCLEPRSSQPFPGSSPGGI